MRRNNPGMMAAGIVLTCVGAVGAIVGVSLISSSQEHIDYDQCSGNVCPQSAVQPEDEEMRNAGIAVALSGVAFIAVGIPLIAVGARKVPLEGPPEARLIVTPGGGALKMTF
jgi:hypothetical protein